MGLSVLAAAAATASASCWAREPEIDASRIEILVEPRVGQHDVERLGEQAHVVDEVGGHVRRVLRRAEPGHDLAKGSKRLVGERRQGQAAAHGGVGVDDPRPTGDRQHANPVALGQAALREQLGDVDDRLHVVDLDQAGLAHGGAVEIVAARHVGGVRGRSLDAGLRGAGLPDQHRLAGLERLAPHLQEAPGVRRPLQIGKAERGALVVQEGGKQLRHVDVGLVARRHAIAEAHALGLGQVDHGIAEAAGLERARHAAGAELGLVGDAAECRIDARLQGQHALAVGADDAHAALGDGPLQLLLELAPFGPRLAEAGRQHHRKRNGSLAAVAQRLAHCRRRHGHDGKVARLTDRAGVGMALEAVQLPILGIDEMDRALVARVPERLDRVPADAGEIRRSADDGDGTWMKETLEAHGCAASPCRSFALADSARGRLNLRRPGAQV